MKIIFYITVITSFLITNLHALPSNLISKKIDEIKSDTSGKVEKYITNYSEYVINLIPGKGITEVSIDLRENYKPDYSILVTRELKNLIMEIILLSSPYSVLKFLMTKGIRVT